MKRMYNLHSLSFFVLICVAFTACMREDDPGAKTVFTVSASASGAQEVPAKNVAGTGTLTGSYDASSNLLTYTLSWTGLTGAPTLMHFHGPALSGANASAAIGITGFPATASGTLSATATLTEAQETDLMGGKWYWNVHTSANGGGEIRGQVSVR